MNIACRLCGRESKTNHGLSQHVRFAHKIPILDYKIIVGEITKEQLRCEDCKKYIGLYKKRTYQKCNDCYQKSDTRKIVSQKILKNRPNFDGENNPNFRGHKTFKCLCGNDFTRRISPCQIGTRFHSYCSTECKKKYSKTISSKTQYKDIKFRSSYEVVLARFLDIFDYKWVYEPEAFKTPYGFYTPDFHLDFMDCYIEVKGFFRDENSRLKYEWFNKNIKKCILITEKEFSNIGACYNRKRGYFSIDSLSDIKALLCQP